MRRYLAGLAMALFAMMLVAVPQAVAPQQAVAFEDYGVTIGDERITSDHTAGDGWSYDPGPSKLTISNWSSGGKGVVVTPPENGRYLGAKSYRAAITSLRRDLIIKVDKVSLGQAGWSEHSNIESPEGTTAFFGIYAPGRKIDIQGTASQADPQVNPDLTIESHANAIYCGSLFVDHAAVNCVSHGTAVMIGENTPRDSALKLWNGAALTAVTKWGRSINCEPQGASSNEPQQRLVNYDGAAVFVQEGKIEISGSTLSGEIAFQERAGSWGTTEGTAFGCVGVFAGLGTRIDGTTAFLRGSVVGGIYKSDTLAHYGVLSQSYDLEGSVLEGTIERAQGSGVWSFDIGQKTQWKYAALAPEICFWDRSESLSDRGIVRSTLRRTSADLNATPEFGSLVYEDPYTVTSTTSISGPDVTLEARCTRSKSLYLRDSNGIRQWSWQRDFHEAHEISGDVRGLFQFGNVVDRETSMKRWRANEGTPDLHVLSGDWTVHPGAGSTANYYIEGGNVVVEAEGGKSYGGGHVRIPQGSTFTVKGDGIWGFWNVMPLSLGTEGGTVRFEGGTARQASGDSNNRVEIVDGNINLSRRDGQLIYDGQGNELSRCAYDMSECPGTLKEIRIDTVANGSVSRFVDLAGFYPIDGKFYLWTKSNESNNGESLGSVTMQDADGCEYKPTVEGPDPESGVYTLEPPAELRVFTPTASGTFYRDLGGSITLTAGTFGKSESMDDKRIEWSYTDAREDTGKTHAIDCDNLSYTIDKLSDDDEWRTYTCRVCRVAAGGDQLLGTYTANVHVVKWGAVQTKVPGVVGQDATLTATTAERSSGWLDDVDSYWEVDKGDGEGWKEIEGSKGDSYTFKVENEGVQNWKFRRHIDQRIIVAIGKAGDRRFESVSPEIQVTFAPVIVTQPADLTVQSNDGGSHSLSVELAGETSDMKYQWQRAEGDAWQDIAGATARELTFTGVNAQPGAYRCVVTNGHGSTTSEMAELTVRQPPFVRSIPAQVEAVQGAEARITASFANAKSNVACTWKYSTDGGSTWTDVTSEDRGDAIHIENIMFIIRTDTGEVLADRGGFLSSTLVINKVAANHAGLQARCVLKDAFGTYESDACQLTVTGISSDPAEPTPTPGSGEQGGGSGGGDKPSTGGDDKPTTPDKPATGGDDKPSAGEDDEPATPDKPSAGEDDEPAKPGEPAKGGETSEPEPSEKPNVEPDAKPTAEQTPAKAYEKKVFSAVTFSKGKLTIKWNRVQGAAGYEVYVSERGSKGKLTAKKFLAKTIDGAAATKASVKKAAGKKLKGSGDYQVTVRAFKLVKGKKRYLTSSPTVHAPGPANAKYTSVKKVKASSKRVSLRAGKSKRVKAKLVKKSASKKLVSAKVRWRSTDPSVAKVSSTGKIAAKKKGTCKVYAMASNGVKATINVIVR